MEGVPPTAYINHAYRRPCSPCNRSFSQRTCSTPSFSMIAAAAVVAALSLGVAQVAAHGGVLSYDIGGTTYEG